MSSFLSLVNSTLHLHFVLHYLVGPTAKARRGSDPLPLSRFGGSAMSIPSHPPSVGSLLPWNQHNQYKFRVIVDLA